MVTIKLVRKGSGVSAVQGEQVKGRVTVDAGLKGRLSGQAENKPFKGRVEKVTGTDTYKLVEILG